MTALALLVLIIAVVGLALVATVVGLLVTRRRRPAPLPNTHTDVIATPSTDVDAPPVELSAPPATIETLEPEPPVLERPEGTASRLVRLRQRLAGSQGGLGRGLRGLLPGGRLEEDAWEAHELPPLPPDVGVAPTQHLVDKLRTSPRVGGEEAGGPRAVR